MSQAKNASTIRATDVMTRRLVTVRPDVDVADGIHVLLKHGVSGAPVVDRDGRFVGVFSEKCCMRVLTGVAELAGDAVSPPPRAADFMARKLFALRPDKDVIRAIGALVERRVSGAPVTEADGTFLGSFSEKTGMKVLLDSIYDQVPTADVAAYMDTDRERLIDERTDLLTVARKFVETPFRRLPIVRDGRVVGQISRRDVLRCSTILATIVRNRVEMEEVAPPRPEGATDESLHVLRAHAKLLRTDVASFMDVDARTIDEKLDLLAIARIFLTTPYRRLPVLDGERVVGQVSRRDVLAAAYHLTDPVTPSESGILYLSATTDRSEMPAL